ncbi:cytochrome P450 [Novispirillum itersonii]|uniref:Cytochrome P450 n=1 Tax=Novispirillum itersonii TaxID=189 RepID=A0A7W9ZCT5_NOVIT|nr:cytochrome P450 [Novispirillum itersonii]MBB6209108.1 cytochrome P450 [Novispirillum itersonii]
MTTQTLTAPKTTARFGLRTLLRLRKDPLATVTSIARAADLVELRVGAERLFVISHPDQVERVLKTNAKGYAKSKFYDRLKPIFGNGMIVAEGAAWKRQRETARPAFGSHVLRAVAEAAVVQARDFMEELRAEKGAADIGEAMMRLTLAVALKVLFNTEVDRATTQRLQGAITTALRTAEKRMWALFPLFSRLPGPSTLRFRRAIRTLDDFVYGMIADRRAMGEAMPRDLLTHMLHWRDSETGKGLPDQILRDEILFMVLAAHETTAAALAWTFSLLAEHPQERQRVQAELDQVLEGRAPGWDDLSNLPVTRGALLESMRLYPPAWSLSRTALADDEVGGFTIPKGSSLMVCPWLTHRDDRFWDQPQAFRPDRFIGDAEDSHHAFAYFPFGGGPRLCIGNNFALIEAMAVLATVLPALDLEVAPGARITPEPMISLRPHGLMMTGRERTRPEPQRRAA